MEPKLNCVIVDDEPLAREVLAEYIGVLEHLNLLATLDNALELDQFLLKTQVDLIFLDIQMPYLTGMEFLKSRSNLPMVIITTAYPNYALDSFAFDVIDYLLKPITFNRFFKAIGKASHYQGKTNPSQQENPLEPNYFFVKCDGKYQKIILDELVFIKSLENYVILQTESERHMTLMPLKTIEEYLDSDKFLRVHKSYIVPSNKIVTVENHQLLLNNQQAIPIGRNYRKSVMEQVLKDNVIQKKK